MQLTELFTGTRSTEPVLVVLMQGRPSMKTVTWLSPKKAPVMLMGPPESRERGGARSNTATTSDHLRVLIIDYSRKKMNECSSKINTYDVSTRLLSCTRVEDELIPPYSTNTVANHCYGIKRGRALSAPLDLTDDWFCAKKYSQNPSINNNPIYNK